MKLYNIIGEYNTLDWVKTAHLISCKLEEFRMELEWWQAEGGHLRRENDYEQKICFLEKELIQVQEDIEDEDAYSQRSEWAEDARNGYSCAGHVRSMTCVCWACQDARASGCALEPPS